MQRMHAVLGDMIVGQRVPRVVPSETSRSDSFTANPVVLTHTWVCFFLGLAFAFWGGVFSERATAHFEGSLQHTPASGPSLWRLTFARLVVRSNSAAKRSCGEVPKRCFNKVAPFGHGNYTLSNNLWKWTGLFEIVKLSCARPLEKRKESTLKVQKTKMGPIGRSQTASCLAPGRRGTKVFDPTQAVFVVLPKCINPSRHPVSSCLLICGPEVS